jgi:SNF2 family DNA or RNA helicase
MLNSTPANSQQQKMAQPLWPGFAYKQHQETGIRWILERESKKPSGGIICDEMGLGKTIQMLAILKGEKFTNTLLIAPVAVLSQWEETAAKSGINVFVPTTGGRKLWKSSAPVKPLAAKLYLIGYEMASKRPAVLMSVTWKRLICDEAHRVGAKQKNLHTMVTKIPAETRWFLTATPIVNSKKDITGLLSLLKAPDSGKPFNDTIGEYVMARSMNDLRSSFPDAPPQPEVHKIRLPFLTDEEQDFYKGISGIIVKRWKMLEDEVPMPGAALMKLKLFLRLRQISLHPQVYIDARRKAGLLQDRPDWSGTSTKFESIKKLVADAGSEHKWIVFCHFHSEMELLQKQLIELPSVGKVHIYNGSLSGQARRSVIEETREPSPLAQVLLIQLQSGGVGLNLQHFDRIVFSGPWWTSALMEQAIGRAVRIGQRSIVQVYHLSLVEEEALNIDKFMSEKADEKGTLCREILASAWPRA